MKPHIKVKQFLLNFNVQCDITNLAATKTTNFLKKIYRSDIFFMYSSDTPQCLLLSN